MPVDGAFNAPESAPIGHETVAANTPPQVPQNAPLPMPPTVPTSTPMPLNAVPTTTTTDVPSTADDGDLIEKEWVLRAKKIVEQTQDDPYKQSKELTTFKADYLHKRYNKNIKLSE